MLAFLDMDSKLEITKINCQTLTGDEKDIFRLLNYFFARTMFFCLRVVIDGLLPSDVVWLWYTLHLTSDVAQTRPELQGRHTVTSHQLRGAITPRDWTNNRLFKHQSNTTNGTFALLCTLLAFSWYLTPSLDDNKSIDYLSITSKWLSDKCKQRSSV